MASTEWMTCQVALSAQCSALWPLVEVNVPTRARRSCFSVFSFSAASFRSMQSIASLRGSKSLLIGCAVTKRKRHISVHRSYASERSMMDVPCPPPFFDFSFLHSSATDHNWSSSLLFTWTNSTHSGELLHNSVMSSCASHHTCCNFW